MVDRKEREPMNTEIELHEQSTDLAETAMKLVVVDKESFDATSKINMDIEKMKKEIIAYHKPLRAATNAAHKASIKREDTDLSPLKAAGSYIRSIRSSYVQEQDEKQRKEQAKKDAAAEKKAEKEREKLRKKAEAEKDEEKKAEIEEQIEEVYVEPVIVESTIEKAEGVSWVSDIEVEVTDSMFFLSEILENKVPMTVLEFKPAKIKAWVKTNAIKNNQIRGIQIKNVKKERVRTG